MFLQEFQSSFSRLQRKNIWEMKLLGGHPTQARKPFEVLQLLLIIYHNSYNYRFVWCILDLLSFLHIYQFFYFTIVLEVI